MTRAQARSISQLLEAARIPHAIRVVYPAAGAVDYRVRVDDDAAIDGAALRALLDAAAAEGLPVSARFAELGIG